MCDRCHCWHLFLQKMAAVPPGSLEVLPGFLKPLVADLNMGSSDGEEARHYMWKASIHIRRWAFSYGGFTFFCWHKFHKLASVTMRIRIWSVKQKHRQLSPPKNGFPKVEIYLSFIRVGSEQPRSGDVRLHLCHPCCLLAIGFHFCPQSANGGIGEDQHLFRDTS